MRLAAGAAMTATIAGLLGASTAPAGAATGATARLHNGILTVTGTPARDVLKIGEDTRRDHRLRDASAHQRPTFPVRLIKMSSISSIVDIARAEAW